MLAKDIMTKDPITVHQDTKIAEVAKLLVEKRISGVPVIDDSEHLVGIISEKDMMAKAAELKIPFYVTLFDSIIFLENPIRFNSEIRKYTASQVKDAMTRKVIAVEENTPMAEVVDILQKKNINRVPVLRHQNIIGIITRSDVLKGISNTV